VLFQGFWIDKWLEAGTLQSCFPWLYEISTTKIETLVEIGDIRQILGTGTLDGIGD